MAIVIHTDVVSYLYKSDTRAELYRPHLNDPPFIISFMSLAELRRWALERNWGERKRQELEGYLARFWLSIRKIKSAHVGLKQLSQRD